jgi:FKBP12-rapamycin complex-associated protein
MLSLDKEPSSKKLLITVYPVIPLSNMTGLIGFLPNCDTISHLIVESRKEKKIMTNLEMFHIGDTYPKYYSATLLSKIEVFKEAISQTSGYELSEIIWSKSLNCESWLIRRTNYSQSLAVMSVVGYILGLGDRHPNNLMMDRQSGKIIHIDYGDCFEIAMKRNKFPEKVPFRLTRMFYKALGAPKIEGIFRIIAEKVMELLRENRESLLSILNTLVYDPLVTFRLMIPLIMKKKENHKILKNNLNDNPLYEEKAHKDIISSSVMNNEYLRHFSKVMAFSFIGLKNEEKNEKSEKSEENNVEKEKEEKKRIENEERQILNYYEENDEIESEELNKIAQILINRITQKLTGMDFNNDKPLDIKEQINILINQATSNENLAQSYLGWYPFW